MKRVWWLIIIFIITAAVGTGCFTVFNNEEFVVKIGDTKVGREEYMFYLYGEEKRFELEGDDDIWETDFDGVSAQEIAKQNVMDTLVLVKVAVNQANNLSITLTDEEIKEAEKKADEQFEEIKAKRSDLNISRETIAFVEKEWAVQQKVFEYITNDFVVSEVDFNSYFEAYLNENKEELNDVSIRYIFIEAGDDAEKSLERAYKKVKDGVSFEKLQREYNSEAKVTDVAESDLDEEIKEAAYNLAEGEVTYVEKKGEGYYIIKATKVVPLDIEALKKELRDVYISEKKQDIYREQSEKWAREFEIEKNNDAWNSIVVGNEQMKQLP